MLPLLVCPRCGLGLSFEADGIDGDGILVHRSSTCQEDYPVIGGIPRILLGPHRSGVVSRHGEWFGRTARRVDMRSRWQETGIGSLVVEGFDYEWAKFKRVRTEEQKRIFDLYFDLVPAAAFDRDALVLDAGSGAGRWAVEAASRGPRIVATDLGASIEVAGANTDPERVACVQADLHDLPFKEGAFDWAYSLGVLHHVDDPPEALRQVVRCVRAGGMVLLYVYYALDNRGTVYRALHVPVSTARMVVSRLPRPLAMLFSSLAAAVLYWPLARSARVLESIGLHTMAASLPLSAYRQSSFESMRNDSLDRFGTRLERRFTRSEVVGLMTSAGLQKVRVAESLPFWHAVAYRPAAVVREPLD
jgi:2-polyprenyl-3-methyl-5-hydroxy-6-metoxy-1,4-benzoquinol methylase